MRKLTRGLLCAACGLAAGAGLARFKFPGYLHAQVDLSPGAPRKPLYVDGGRRQFLALSVTGTGGLKGLEVRVPGARAESWFPPAVRLPGGGAPEFADGVFTGFAPGRRLPVYASLDGGEDALDFFDASTGELIRSVKVVRGGADGGHQH